MIAEDRTIDHVVRVPRRPPGREPLFDDGGLQIELHVGRDRRADQADDHADVRRILEIQVGTSVPRTTAPQFGCASIPETMYLT